MEVQATSSAESSSSGVTANVATTTTTQRLNKHRLLRSELNFLPRTDGSCALEQGSTVLWASVNGPGDVPSSKRLDETLYVEMVYRHAQTNLPSVKANRLIGYVVKQTVDRIRYPHRMLAVTVQELQCDGSEMAAAITATCLALLDSGIAMNGIFCGVCVAALHDATLLLDPCRKDLQESDATFTFVFKSSATVRKGEQNPKIVLFGCTTEGVYEYGVFDAAMQLAHHASRDIFVFLRESIQRKLSVDSWMIERGAKRETS